MACRLISVVVAVPLLEALTYRVPDDLPMAVRGARVLAPLGARVVTGCVIASPAAEQGEEETPSVECRDVLDVLDAEPFIPPPVLDLALWVAEYYLCGPGEAVAAAMPPRAWIESDRLARITDRGRARLAGVAGRSGTRVLILETLRDGKPVRTATLGRMMAARAPGPAGDATPPRPRGVYSALAALEREGLVETLRPLTGSAAAFRTFRVAALTVQGHERPRGLSSTQREALDLLGGAPDGLPFSAFAARGIPPATLKRLAARGLVALRRERLERDPFVAPDGVLAPSLPGPEPEIGMARHLTAEQEGALARLADLAVRRSFHVALLHGVTGSGKTEVYLRLASLVRQAGRGVLVLVPEIALTPGVATAFRRSFGERVAIQHSGLSDGERHDQWQRIRRGDVDVVIGTRSAVFAPLASPGLIVVDEEHDASYKQEESPRYHGRDVAVMRGKREGALVVLGSATPSLESYYNALATRYELLALERRVHDRPLAAIRVVNMREEFAAAGPDVVLGSALREALQARIARQEQAIVLLNRRGYATAVFCRQCAGTLECPNCSVSLTVHRAVRRARCHYCNYSLPVPGTCALCAGPYLEQLGFGTERVEAEIGALLPAARVARLDRDMVRRRGALVSALERFARGEIDVLVGTQMIAKGHDFPRVTLVGVISADVGLGLADFRAAERTFQILTQVAGRAGRGERRGEAIIQTLYPDHYSVRLACRQDYGAFYREEIAFRQAMRYPPVVGLMNVVVRGTTAAAAMTEAADLARRLRTIAPPAVFKVLGPAPAPLGRLRGQYRAQIFLKGGQRPPMRAALAEALTRHPELRRRVTIDVDPLSVL